MFKNCWCSAIFPQCSGCVPRLQTSFNDCSACFIFKFNHVVLLHILVLNDYIYPSLYVLYTAVEMSAGTNFHFETCRSNDVFYYCTCEPGFTGDHCRINIDECASNPCVHGKCVDGSNQYDCVCQNGYWGKNCEKKINIDRGEIL